MQLGETGSGKSTLLNMLVNFYRGSPQGRTALPEVKNLNLAVPTKWLKATEPEGRKHSERNATDRELNLARSASCMLSACGTNCAWLQAPSHSPPSVASTFSLMSRGSTSGFT